MRSKRRQDFAAAVLCVLAGILLSIWPHLLAYARTGDAGWISSDDEIFYLQMAGAAQRGRGFSLTDPALAQARPVLYSSLSLLPGILPARALGLGPMAIGVLWRLWAGFAMGLTWFLLTRSVLSNPWAALGAALVLMSDAGMLFGWLGVGHYRLLAEILRGPAGALSQSGPNPLPQWRIINPALSLPFFLAHLLLLRRAVLEPTALRVAASAVAFGLLFYVYFFYWTAAALGLAVAWALSAPSRRTYAAVAVLGAIVALPAAASQIALHGCFSPATLHRIGVLAPIPHFQGLLFPKLAIALMIFGFFWVVRERRDLICFWSAALAGLLLSNEQVLTGLINGNEHWAYAWGPALSLLMIVSLRDATARLKSAWLAPALGLFCAVHFLSALGIRSLETRIPDVRMLSRAYRQYREQRRSAPVLAPQAVVAGASNFVDMAVLVEGQRPLFSYASILSPSIGDEELLERLALDAYLVGAPRQELRERLQGYRLNSSLDLERTYDRVASDPNAFLRKFNVATLALPASGARPPLSGWKLTQDGPYWTLWSRGG